jgi:hypothetical protein
MFHRQGDGARQFPNQKLLPTNSQWKWCSTMSISIQISAEQMSNPAIADALANLMRAMGGVSTLPVASAPVAAAPAASPVASAPVVSAPVAAEKKAAKQSKKSGVSTLSDLMKQVSDNSNAFLKLLEQHKRLTMAEAKDLLGLSEEKAVGGVVGGISRKAQKFGLYPPFSKGKNGEGERYWVWTGDVTKKAEPVEAEVVKKRKPGRPKGSTNKKRKPGRPKKK